MKKVVVKWVAGNSSMPVLGESYRSFYSVFSQRKDLDVSYVILYNGKNIEEFKKSNFSNFPEAEIIDQFKFDFNEFPIPVKGCLWKEFPRMKMYPDAYELYVDIDIILVNCIEILQWIDSPLKSLLLYKNDSDFNGYNRGPADAKPYVDSVRFVNSVNQLNADLCAGFYGTPPNLELNQLFIDTINDLISKDPIWKDISSDGYGSDQGIFCYFVSRFAVINKDIPFFILSNERHPFCSITENWDTGWVNFQGIEFLHVSGSTSDWKPNRKVDLKFYKYIINKIKRFRPKSITKDSTNINKINIEILNKNQIKGRINSTLPKQAPLVLSLAIKALRKLSFKIYSVKGYFDYLLGKVERGQYEIGLYLDVLSLSNQLLYSISIDIKNDSFNFNPRIFIDDPVKVLFREYDKVILEKVVD